MWLFAQDDGGGAATGAGIAAALAGGLCPVVIAFVLTIAAIAGLWKVFEKAGKPGWAAIVPIYNLIVLLEVVGRPLWWIVLFLLPCINIFAAAIVFIDLAKSFGKSAGYGIGLWLFGFIFLPMLGFGKDKYLGPSAPQQ